MKKLISMLLAMVMLLGLLTACGNNKDEAVDNATQDTTAEDNTAETTLPEETTAPEDTGDESMTGALEILQNVWDRFGDDEKFPVYGGNPKENYEDNTIGNPDVYDLSDLEMAAYSMLIPAEWIKGVDDAATMTHEMMANNFNAVVVHLNGDVDKFVDAYYKSVAGNQWMCGMPEKMFIAVIDENYIVMVYGLKDVVDMFGNKMLDAYTDTDIKLSEDLV